MKDPFVVVSCFAVAAASSLAAAGTIELAPIKDNTLFEDATGSISNGMGQSILVGRTGIFGGGLIKRGVIAFDVAGNVPKGATVLSVTLTLDLESASNNGDAEQTVELHRLLADWGEGESVAFGGKGAPAEPDDATWLHTFYDTMFWTNPGGDFDPTVSASQVVGDVPGPVVWGSTAQMVADVQGWVDDPATNFGWAITGNEIDSFTGRRFASRETRSKTAVAPVLQIEIAETGCPWDCDGKGDGVVSTADLLALLAQWGEAGTSCDFDGHEVGTSDLLKLLANWGACP